MHNLLLISNVKFNMEQSVESGHALKNSACPLFIKFKEIKVKRYLSNGGQYDKVN